MGATISAREDVVKNTPVGAPRYGTNRLILEKLGRLQSEKTDVARGVFNLKYLYHNTPYNDGNGVRGGPAHSPPLYSWKNDLSHGKFFTLTPISDCSRVGQCVPEVQPAEVPEAAVHAKPALEPHEKGRCR
jgi:hypothetical protein